MTTSPHGRPRPPGIHRPPGGAGRSAPAPAPAPVPVPGGELQ
ncbi:hypothetical protein [Streptomyces celluloflavus]